MARLKQLAAIAALTSSVYGLDLRTDNVDSVKSVASTIAHNMVSHYHGNESGNAVGVLDPPYYFWEAGVMFDTLIQYWHLTGDDQYNDIVSKGLRAQVGSDNDFSPANQSATLGNDDQATWALAAMSAAESKYPEPEGGDITWFSLADAVFNEQVLRWEDKTCDGGLRWQIFPFTNGYNYKNSISNGMFFQLASRLARYTGNSTYSDWATKSFDWTTKVGFIDEKWNVYDGARVDTNCGEINHAQFSYGAGTFIAGAAHMYNTTDGSSKWKSALDGLLNQTLSVFFPDQIVFEVACEEKANCNVDMHIMKGILAQNLAGAIQVAPYTNSAIMPKLQRTATAAAENCVAGACEFAWTQIGEDENDRDIGNELSALSYVQGLLVKSAAGPAKASTTTTGTTGGGNGTNTTTGPGSETSGTATTSGTGSPTPSPNAGSIVGPSIYTSGAVAAILGSVAWLIL